MVLGLKSCRNYLFYCGFSPFLSLNDDAISQPMRMVEKQIHLHCQKYNLNYAKENQYNGKSVGTC